MSRVLEPEVMDTWEDAVEYDSMDFTEVNTAFAQLALELGPQAGLVLDVGTGTSRIPIIIAQMRPQWQIWAIDLSENMLKVGAQNVEDAGLQEQIKLERVDGKQMPYRDSMFDMVISNSIVHHLPDPLPFFREVKRLLKPGGGILLRDLIRPADVATMDALVARISGEYNQYQTQLFRDSLHAALTLDEVNQMVLEAGLSGVRVYQSSDIHWTAERPYQQMLL
ncbi:MULTISPECIES: class I SAM-dependent methyltransferase [unclassified Moorena]|uniref:class I SAM-dependent methyltransferase n=1 Tax=unclassified Moorena TaxID=2683338 RepID=UPI0013BD5F5E|nr:MULTISPECIES: class I SAM-dependent methyltransferase [unclassified Moorena]NEP35440.1 class I SAM-dependent methyltransferase [Moorena sp. SIO3B2]NEQ09302.1 class I SAM-dependent methyltransferase [Moorena sp. SIO4E2]NES87338.1 class I SAM-dependent methyltransferase [Moorena sp. SIO2B7]